MRVKSVDTTTINNCLDDITSSVEMVRCEMKKSNGVNFDIVLEIFDTIKSYCTVAMESVPQGTKNAAVIQVEEDE